MGKRYTGHVLYWQSREPKRIFCCLHLEFACAYENGVLFLNYKQACLALDPANNKLVRCIGIGCPFPYLNLLCNIEEWWKENNWNIKAENRAISNTIVQWTCNTTSKTLYPWIIQNGLIFAEVLFIRLWFVTKMLCWSA